MTNPLLASSMVEPNSIIRLVGYKPQPGVSDEAFIAAWRMAANQVTVTPTGSGLIYRELCRQRPDWNTKIADEIQNPNPYTFIDYAVLSPDADPERLLALPDIIASQYQRIEGTYQITYRFIQADQHGEPLTLLYNLFETDSAAAEQSLTMSWPNRANFQSTQVGFFSAMFHRHATAGLAIVAFNRAEWLSVDDYARTTASLDKQFPVAGRSDLPERDNPAVATPAGSSGSNQSSPPPIAPVRSFLGLYTRVAFVERQADARPLMKAVRFYTYGAPEVLRYEDTVRPVAGAGQLLIRVQAVGLNPLDAKIRSGDMRTMNPAWFPDILGYDIAGTVDAVGAGVTNRQPGEAVYGTNTPMMRRGYAEYAVVPAASFLPKPQNLDFLQAATVPSVASTANNALFAIANLQVGQTVLIHGGSGSVGTFATQLAKQAGAKVIATASAASLQYVKSLGADEVIDYKTQRFESLVSDVDVVLDTMGGDTRARSWPVLRRGGVLVTLVPPLPDQAVAAQYGVRAMMNQNRGEVSGFFARITDLIEKGLLRTPQIGLVLPLSEAAQAHTLLAQGSVHGRIVLEVK